MPADEQIRRDVEAELRWDPEIEAADIGVAVLGGVVTLAGFVPSYSQKIQAEEDAKRVTGVRAVADDIQVRLSEKDKRPDPEIARDAVREISHRVPSAGTIKVTVRNGFVLLEGEAEWQYERERAEKAVRALRGVSGVANLIGLQSKVAATTVKSQIEDALRRSGETDAKNITVEVEGEKVVLRGQVGSYAERLDAERAAWRAPGVGQVEDLISIRV